MNNLEKLYDACLRAVEAEPPVAVWEEIGLSADVVRAAREKHHRLKTKFAKT